MIDGAGFGAVCEAHHIATHARRRQCSPSMTERMPPMVPRPQLSGRITFSAPYSFHALLRAV